jgi:Tol biopolymer transport system component
MIRALSPRPGICGGDYVSTIVLVPRAGGTGRFVCLGTAPCWAPDGKSIAYSFSSSDSTGLCIRSLAGNDATLLKAVDAAPGSFSPDGKWIVYITQDAASQVGILPSDGGESIEVALPPGLRTPRTVSWSPDGTQLLLTNAWGEIWIISLDPIPKVRP